MNWQVEIQRAPKKGTHAHKRLILAAGGWKTCACSHFPMEERFTQNGVTLGMIPKDPKHEKAGRKFYEYVEEADWRAASQALVRIAAL
jgi:hypothetical protein